MSGIRTQADVAAHDTAALDVRDVSKAYRLYDSPRARLKGLLTGGKHYRSHWALRGVNFALARGQCLGVVGSNGAGKSTLLKLVTGTIRPSAGSIQVDGRITAILELGAGFHPDFTGRQNLHFSGGLIGLEAAKLQQLEPDILAFAELGEAIDRPVRTYSSGMTVRLAFALVTAVQPDVLIVDEALAVGDQRFQKKCIDRIQHFRKNGCSILFCSHSQYHIRELCDVALWLDCGRQRMFGDTEEVLAAYEQHLRQIDVAAALGDAGQVVNELADAAHSAEKERAFHGGSGAVRPGNGQAARIAGFSIDALDARETPPLLTGRDLVVNISVRMPTGEVPSLGVMLEQHHGQGITSVLSHRDGFAPVLGDDGLWRGRLRFTDLPLNTGEYVLSLYLFDAEGLVVYEEWLKCQIFKFRNPATTPGVVQLSRVWDAP